MLYNISLFGGLLGFYFGEVLCLVGFCGFFFSSYQGSIYSLQVEKTNFSCS